MPATAEPRVSRVLMTGDTVGGVWTFTLELAEALGAHGVEVVLAALGGYPSEAQVAEASAIRNLYLLPSDFKLEWMDEPWGDVEDSGRWLLQLEREYRPDVVHLNSFGHGSLGSLNQRLAPTVLTAHSCVLSWWEAAKGGAAPASWDRYRTEVGRSLQAADLVAAPSRAMAAALARHYGAFRTKGAAGCEVIPNGRNPARFRRGPREPFVFTAGRIWDEAKNAAAVARIAPGLPWPVFLAGDAQSATFDGCRMLGRLTAAEIAAWYARAAIYAMPARYEPFGLSILEAALSGCALVLGDIPSLREIWGDAALFVAPDDPRRLREAIESLIHAPALREKMSQRAHDRALEFDAARMAQRYLKAYRSAIAVRSAPCVS